jgi:hypothetical protein
VALLLCQTDFTTHAGRRTSEPCVESQRPDCQRAPEPRTQAPGPAGRGPGGDAVLQRPRPAACAPPTNDSTQLNLTQRTLARLTLLHLAAAPRLASCGPRHASSGPVRVAAHRPAPKPQARPGPGESLAPAKEGRRGGKPNQTEPRDPRGKPARAASPRRAAPTSPRSEPTGGRDPGPKPCPAPRLAPLWLWLSLSPC